MTLILTCLTRKYVIQVSDMRFTRLEPRLGGAPQTRIVEENGIKALVYCGCAVFGYTGLAAIQDERTDQWLGKILAAVRPQNLQGALDEVQRKATEVFGKMAIPNVQKRHAFVVGGFGYQGNTYNSDLSTDEIQPCAWVISNALDDQLQWQDTARSSFTEIQCLLRKDLPCLLIPAGANLSGSEYKAINRELRQCIQRKMGANALIQVLVRGVRNASKRNVGVGRNAIAVSLPTAAAKMDEPGKQNFRFAEGDLQPKLDETSMGSLFYPDGNFDGIWRSPTYVFSNSMLTDFTMKRASIEEVVEFNSKKIGV